MSGQPFVFGDWAVDPEANRLSAGDAVAALEPRAMEVLVALCQRPGEVLSADDLLTLCWGDAPLGDNPVHKMIAQLRRALGDSATEPRYIETIRKRGYRAIAPVRSSGGPIEQARDGAWTSGSPFRGLLAFDQAHAQVFYGREAATRALLDAAVQQVLREGDPSARGLCLVLGPSGSGKTSLVRAGLFPALLRPEGFGGLRALSSTDLDLGDVQGDAGPQGLLLALAAALLDWELEGGKPMFPGASAASLAAHLHDGIEMVRTEMEWALARHPVLDEGSGLNPPLSVQLLFIDRLETLFVAPHIDEAQRQQFLAVLQALAESGRVLVVAACRNDFYPRLVEYPLLMRNKAQGAHYDLAPPTRAEIAQMIRLPARAAGLSFGHDEATQTRLDDVLCDDASHSPDALPLLQYTLEELYRQRGPHGELSFEAYKQLGGQVPGSGTNNNSSSGGGLEGAIGLRAETLIAGLLPLQQAALPHVLSLLVILSGEESRATSRRALWAELRDAAERELVQALVDERLLVSDLIDQQAGFRVAHEAILRRWPRVTEWIAAHQQALQLRSRLRVQVQRWLDEQRSAEYLLPKGKQLAETRELLSRVEFSFSTAEQDFLDASLRRARRGERLRAGVVVGTSALALLAAVLAWRADRAEGIAQQRRAQADDLVGYMLGDFADKLRPIGRLELLNNVGTKAMEHLSADSASGGPSDANSVLQRAKALTVIGEVRVSKRELDAAIEPLKAARRLLTSDPPSGMPAAHWHKAQGTAAFWEGHAHFTQRRFAEARTAWQSYKEYSEQWLKAEPDQIDAQVELSYAQSNLGILMLDTGDLQNATQQLRDAIALMGQALAKRPEDSALQGEWATAMSWLGTSLLWQGQFQQAVDTFKQSLTGISNNRSQAPKDLDWMEREASAHIWLGSSLQRMGKSGQAAAEFAAARKTLNELLQQDSKNRVWRLMQAQLVAESQPASTGGGAQQAQLLRDQIKDLVALDGGPSASVALRRLPWRAKLNTALARELQKQGKHSEAERLLNESMTQLRQGIVQRPEDLRLRTQIAQVRMALAELFKLNKNQEAATAQCRDLAAELSELPALLRVHFEITEAWVAAQSCLDREGQVLREREWLAQRARLEP